MTIRTTITLLKPALDGGFTPLGAPETFTGDDSDHIAAAVNEWLRIEVTPYWEPHTLRMDVAIEALDAATSEALLHTLRGIAIAWRLTEPMIDDDEEL